MELRTAIEILEYYQEWRLGKREDMIHEPQKLTEALDLVLSEVKKIHLGAVSGRSEQLICPCCGSDKTYKTDAIHCNRCAITTEI